MDEQTFWGPDFDALQAEDPEIGGVLLDELERQDKQVGLVTMCTGGGMGTATIIERV